MRNVELLGDAIRQRDEAVRAHAERELCVICLESVREVVDSHVHFSGVGGLTSKFHDAAYFGEGAKRRDAYTEEEFEIQAVACGLDVDRCVFVECMLGDAVAEASWALERCKSHDSKIGAVVAHAPAPDGGDAVEEFLRRLPGCDCLLYTSPSPRDRG